MAFPVTVTFHGIASSEALRASVVERAHRLERFAADIIDCDVVIASQSNRHQQGNAFDVRVKLALPGRNIEVGGRATADDRHADPYVAVGDTFDVLRRRVEEYVRQRRGEVKQHA